MDFWAFRLQNSKNELLRLLYFAIYVHRGPLQVCHFQELQQASHNLPLNHELMRPPSSGS